MPASIAHMLISQQARVKLSGSEDIKDFVDLVLTKNKKFMELGSLGPDLPYYGNLLKGGWDTFVNHSERPMGFDHWSYQLHSKAPNVFSLKLIEVTWKETNPDIEEWEDEDRIRFAFLCGFLTHMAADQIIHPVVNRIAGPYYKRRWSRDLHRRCEVHQDVYLLSQPSGKLTKAEFAARPFASWCSATPVPVWNRKMLDFRYFLQKAFVEAHAVTPSQWEVGRWAKGITTTLGWLTPVKLLGHLLGPYGEAYSDLFDADGYLRPDSPEYAEYIKLEKTQDRTYDAFVAEAIELSMVYIRAAWKVYECDSLTNDIRAKFLNVVQDADLSGPLEKNILKTAQRALQAWT